MQAVAIANSPYCAPAQMENFYFADMCHEIRTPLTAILGISQILLTPMCSPQKQGQCVQALRDSTTMLKELIDVMLDNLRLESGKMELDHASFDLAKTVQEAVHIVMPKAEEKGLNLYVHIGRIPVSLMGDSLRIRQIVINLLSNAVKFTDSGYVRLDVQAVPDTHGGYRVRIAVTDSGIGIAPQQQARIFDKYTQAEASTYRRYGGTGLGLTICRELARLMQGDIMVESALGKGSCFTALLRLDAAEAMAAAA